MSRNKAETTEAREAVIYVRVSTTEQELSGLGLADQEARCRGYCAAQGWTVTGVYSDGVSGKTLDRPELARALEALGLRAEVTPVGDKHVWRGMVKSGALLGGEPSGHVIFREFLPTGDGILTALQVLAVLAETGRSFSALTSLAVEYPQALVNVTVKERVPLEKIPGFPAAVAAIEKSLGATGRTLIRYSGTEPLLRVMIEGPDRALITAHAERLASIVKAAGV